MNILVVGSGGREHALAWKLASDPGVRAIWCAPGNAGIARVATPVDIAATDVDALAAFARRERIDLTVVGPEAPLDRGIVDRFRAEGLLIFGPSQAASALECSKAFAKHAMARHGIPTARYHVCDDADAAHSVVERGELGLPIVVKADGLAAGKGVVVAPDRESAHAAIRAAMEERQFGAAGARVVLEEALQGPEVSFFALCDGTRALPLVSAQDHKRAFDDDKGPNTGGMGEFAPSPLMDAPLQAEIMRTIVSPLLSGMRAEGKPYHGFLYVGLMLTCNGPKVIEFNVRFGDPEAQVVIPMIEEPLAPLLAAAARGALPQRDVAFSRRKHVGVVVASGGYPGPVETGVTIDGLDAAEALDDVLVFHAGTANADGRVVTTGGRVLTIVGRGDSFDQAIARAYAGVERIRFDGMRCRTDIGRKALN